MSGGSYMIHLVGGLLMTFTQLTAVTYPTKHPKVSRLKIPYRFGRDLGSPLRPAAVPRRHNLLLCAVRQCGHSGSELRVRDNN